MYATESESGPQAAAVEEPRVIVILSPEVLAQVPDTWLQSALASNVWFGLNSIV